MRVKTEAKRDAIVEMAGQVFLESGYERASMGQIAERVGGSKGTLYSYFPSKEALFVEVMLKAGEREFAPVIAMLQPGAADLGAMLRRWGEALLGIMCKPAFVAARRVIASEAGQSDIGKRFHERGPKVGEAMMQAFLSAEMQAGRLRDADPQLAAVQLMALLEAETMHRLMLGVLTQLSRAEIKRIADRAVTTFLVAYKPAP